LVKIRGITTGINQWVCSSGAPNCQIISDLADLMEHDVSPLFKCSMKLHSDVKVSSIDEGRIEGLPLVKNCPSNVGLRRIWDGC
jgi:hypothetical protein